LSIWTLIILIALAWLSYPFAGAASVSADVLDGKRPKGAGFSFLPELIVFPAAFVGVAALIDFFAMPWGRRIVGGLCVVMLAMHSFLFLRGLLRTRSAKKNAALPSTAQDRGHDGPCDSSADSRPRPVNVDTSYAKCGEHGHRQ
jgi:hypothetical protein